MTKTVAWLRYALWVLFMWALFEVIIACFGLVPALVVLGALLVAFS